MDFDLNLSGIPKRDWGKELLLEMYYRGKTLKIFAVKPQAHLIGTTMPLDILNGFAPDSILVKAFEKNYKTAAKPNVVSNYGFKQRHGEPIELLDYVFETIYDRACEAEMNRYRLNSKNYESGRYVDYVKHGLTIVLPYEEDLNDPEFARYFAEEVVLPDFMKYVDYIQKGWKKQHARRVFGTYIAVESVYKTNLRSLMHMSTQRSAEYSPNGREAEPEISDVVTQMLKSIEPYLPVFYKDVIEQVSKGYR